MENQKNNKGVIGVLIVVIILLLLIICYLLFGNKVLNKCKDNSTTTTLTTNPATEYSDVYLKDVGKVREEKNIDENNKQNEKLLNSLNKKSFNSNDNLYSCVLEADEQNCTNNYFEDNNKKIYVDRIGSLSLGKESNANNEEYEEYIYIYKVNNYYISLNHDDAGDGGRFKIYDGNINLLFSSSWDDGVIYYSENIIYYGVGACEILRPDEKIGMGIVVYEYNLENRTNKYLFNLNHDAGWAC